MSDNRSIFVIGNGLGMALDPHCFSLKTALASAWSETGEGLLDEFPKKQVMRCLDSEDISTAPTSEEELETLQRVIAACDFLDDVGDGEISWLSEQGQSFPKSVRRYFGLTAAHFQNHTHILPESFIDSFCEYLRNTKSHIATLNYDNLLYRPFIEHGVCQGYNGCLVDGFHASGGFDPDNLERKYAKDFGWYMHLHGSPLFMERPDGAIEKIQQSRLPETHHEHKHLILTHYDYKLAMIEDSVLLSAYWDYFGKAMKESRNLVMFGYSGLDKHINERIKDHLDVDENCMNVRVVEWSGAGENREGFWKKRLGECVEVTLLDSILEFDFCDLD